MDVLIVERDELLGALLADTLDVNGIGAHLVPGETEALALPHDARPRVLITGINRGMEDAQGLEAARRLRARWPGLGVIYLAALWPVRLPRYALGAHDRFLNKPVGSRKLVQTVRELLGSITGSFPRPERC